MCGRYANARHDGDLLRDFQIASVVEDAPEPSWNIAPTDPGRVVLERLVDDQPDRQLRTLKWGLVPFWAKDVEFAAKHINARSETFTTKPAFKSAAAKHRCIVPADGYYEWMVAEDGKHPMYLYGDTCSALRDFMRVAATSKIPMRGCAPTRSSPAPRPTS